MLDRRKLLVGATALAGYSALARAAAPYEWQTISPADAGFVPGFGERLDQFVLGGQAPNIHGVIIVRRGRVVFENYFEGDDQVRDEHGRAHFERVAFSAERSHELRSVSKSIVGLLYGIALGEGKVPPLDAPLLAQFPQLHRSAGPGAAPPLDHQACDHHDAWYRMERGNFLRRSAQRADRDGQGGRSLSLCAGAADRRGGGRAVDLLWRRDRADRKDSGERHPTEVARLRACGAVRSARALGRPYGASAPTASETSPPASACGPAIWRASGRCCSTRGKAGEQQIVPADWLEESFKPQVTIRDRREYGCHWYLGEIVFNSADGPRAERWIAAFGNGGQRLYVFPRLDLLVVITAGNYNRRDQGVPPNRVLTERILPSLHVNPN